MRLDFSTGVEFHGLIDNKIVGGKPVSKDEIPFQVSFQRRGRHFCGGSIVDRYWIVTAAHCCVGNVNAVGQLTVVAGEHDRHISEGTEQIIPVEKVVVHEDYNGDTIEHDICMLKLTHRVQFGRSATKVELPARLSSFYGTATVSGWGSLHQDDSTLPRQLYAVNVPLVDKNST